jgi:hypothetical protein
MARRITEALDSIVSCFESGDIPEAVAYSVVPVADIPSAQWSLLNRALMYIAGTMDARGFLQWKRAKRYVKKGARALYILVPRMVIREKEDGEEKEVLAGFLARPVCRMEDTEEELLVYQKIELPDLPLMERAQEWGISIKTIPANIDVMDIFQTNRRR